MRPAFAHATKFRRSRQHGATIVEFALVAIVFMMLLLGIVDFGRWLYTMNAATEATRLGARIAVVCDLDDTAIKARMQEFIPQATNAKIVITYYGSDPLNPGNWVAGCTVENCAGVTVQLSNVTIESIAWFLPSDLPIPPFSTALVRESLRSAIDGSNNPVCD